MCNAKVGIRLAAGGDDGAAGITAAMADEDDSGIFSVCWATLPSHCSGFGNCALTDDAGEGGVAGGVKGIFSTDDTEESCSENMLLLLNSARVELLCSTFWSLFCKHNSCKFDCRDCSKLEEGLSSRN